MILRNSWPRDIDAFIDPSEIIKRITIPVLAFYGDLDVNIDPVQGAEAYEVGLEAAGNRDYKVEVLNSAAQVFVSDPSYLDTNGRLDSALILLETLRNLIDCRICNGCRDRIQIM